VTEDRIFSYDCKMLTIKMYQHINQTIAQYFYR